MEDISTHGHAIDEQMTETMWEAGISFLASQFFWRGSSGSSPATGPGEKIKNFPGGATGSWSAAFFSSAWKCLALGVFGVKAWGNVYFTPPGATPCPFKSKPDNSLSISAIPGPMESLALAPRHDQ